MRRRASPGRTSRTYARAWSERAMCVVPGPTGTLACGSVLRTARLQALGRSCSVDEVSWSRCSSSSRQRRSGRSRHLAERLPAGRLAGRADRRGRRLDAGRVRRPAATASSSATRSSWQDTICSRMVQGLGPHVSARVEADAVYSAGADRPVDLALGAYVGTALLGAERRGARDALRHRPRSRSPTSLRDVLPLVTRAGRRAGAAAPRGGAGRGRRAGAAAAAEVDAVRCPLTGALNRRGWLQQLEHAGAATPTAAARTSRCSRSTSTTSSAPTTASGTPRATRCCAAPSRC